ncbi:DnaB helicase C terminal domain protein [Bacillus phage Eldridge]|uniref:DnaB helicase C terminal domain protein n=1 Tax=Bacillus phage Eldridge TaxID=1776293 RepID=A0A0Y0AMQ1_9CAUD|nr:DnaB helicase C terminal domain protein [Bacillus phage Eldridge]AMB18676.1 DnaB helicase C terminal domain protein [Bacillus phage Eldridge]
MSNTPIQKAILRKAIESPLFSKEILPKAPMSMYDGNKVNEEISSLVKRYYQTNNTLLTEDALLTLTQEKLDRMRKDAAEQEPYFAAINELYEIRNQQDDAVLDENIEKYIKKHMHLDLMQRALAGLNDERTMEQVADEWKNIMLLDVSGKQQDVINLLDDTDGKKEQLSSLHTNVIPTGFKELDEITGGGLGKGEVGLHAHLSGSGKTLWLTNHAANYTRGGYNVLFIALEELKNRMVLRLEQALLRQPRSNILTGNQLNEENFNKMQDFIQNNRSHFGNLFFARYSPRTVTPAKIDQLISDTIIREGIPIDVVIIDYPDLLRNPQATGNESDDGGKLFEEIRRIAQEYNVVMWVASQLNRSARSAQIKTGEHIEGSVRKINAVEVALVGNSTEEEYNSGFTRLYMEKIRNRKEDNIKRMLGFKVVGNAQTIIDYRTEQEMKEHIQILEEAKDKLEQSFKSKKKDNSGNTIDYANEINQALHNMRG